MLSANSMIVVPVFMLVVLIGALVLLRKLLEQNREISSREKYREVPFESSNPPKGVGKGRLGFQYLGYLIAFMSLEPAVVLIAFIAAAPEYLISRVLELYLILVAVYAPLLVYGLREAKRVAQWHLQEV
ncbi:MAG: NADH-quinone oxidoreductase subunit A [Nitrososphaera sp.]|nr:MAG: NADH-quinone oxidoreductase subunit A [Nitrososphaera sp.]